MKAHEYRRLRSSLENRLASRTAARDAAQCEVDEAKRELDALDVVWSACQRIAQEGGSAPSASADGTRVGRSPRSPLEPMVRAALAGLADGFTWLNVRDAVHAANTEVSPTMTKRTTIAGILKRLQDDGLVEVATEANGPKPATFRRRATAAA